MRRISYTKQRNIVHLATQASAGVNCIYYTNRRLEIGGAIKDFSATLKQTAFNFSFDKQEKSFTIKPGGGSIQIKETETIADNKPLDAIREQFHVPDRLLGRRR